MRRQFLSSCQMIYIHLTLAYINRQPCEFDFEETLLQTIYQN